MILVLNVLGMKLEKTQVSSQKKQTSIELKKASVDEKNDCRVLILYFEVNLYTVICFRVFLLISMQSCFHIKPFISYP